LRIWVIASFVAAVYGIFAQAGFGFPLFRAKEFFIAQVQRLSGSFEYPNVAAAYFAMSLPVVWESSLRPRFKWTVVLAVWSALLLTFSRGAVAAVLIVAIAEAVVLWSKRRAYGTAVTVILAAVAATATMAVFTPNLFNTYKRFTTANAPAAQYKAAWNRLRQQPGVRDEIQLNIQNAGTISWPAKGRGRVAISYRWRNLDSSMTIVGSQITSLDRDVRPGESLDVVVGFETPQTPARYILAVEPFVRDLDWFSNAGSPPFYIEAEIASGVSRAAQQADLSGWYRLRAQRIVSTAVVSRSALWKAAVTMFIAHPAGVGPDNYRLQAGRLLDVANWNTDVHSNNLYLELLTGSGILGLVGFAFVLISIPWQVKAACLAISVFLIHGLVDTFLMSTPIYFSFWILVGLHRKNEIRSTASPIL
jgi:O-antigen ligase